MTSQSLIARKAYSLWESKGCPEGTAEKDWKEAERLIELYMHHGGLVEIRGVAFQSYPIIPGVS